MWPVTSWTKAHTASAPEIAELADEHGTGPIHSPAGWDCSRRLRDPPCAAGASPSRPPRFRTVASAAAVNWPISGTTSVVPCVPADRRLLTGRKVSAALVYTKHRLIAVRRPGAPDGNVMAGPPGRRRLFEHVRSTVTEPRGLLEGHRDGEQPLLASVRADELDAHGQPVRGKAGGHRDGRAAGHRHVISGAQPGRATDGSPPTVAGYSRSAGKGATGAVGSASTSYRSKKRRARSNRAA
jgi:hypothetical protein